MENELQKYSHFFTLDLEIKKRIYDLNYEDLDYNKAVKYSDKLYDGVSSLKNKFLKMCTIFDLPDDIINFIDNFISKVNDRIVNTDYSAADLKNIYNTYFASMSSEFLTEIRKNIYGDSMIYLEEDTREWLLEKCTSFNELLHFMHAYITNNLDFLIKFPMISEKNDLDGSVTLRGIDSPLGREIYDYLSIDLIGTTDIIQVDEDKILITIRDRGHALQFETESKNDHEMGVYYFIPKVLDAEMFKDIRGITKVKEGDSFAFGSFVTEKENLANDICEIINKVPTDYEWIKFTEKKVK